MTSTPVHATDPHGVDPRDAGTSSSPPAVDRRPPASRQDARRGGWRAILRPVQRQLWICLVLVVVSTAAGLVPMIGIVELAHTLLPALFGEHVDAGRAWLVVWISAGALAVRLITIMAAAWLSHVTDLALSLHIRRSLVTRLGRIPLGWFTDRNSGLVKKAVQDDVSSLHHLVAHAVLEITGAVTAPVIVLVYLVLVDWRMALITLVPLVAGMIGYSIAMRGARERMVEYDASIAELDAAAVEFVNGIAVVKTFGQAGRAHRRFADIARRFVAFYHGWMRHSAGGMLIMEIALAPVTTALVVLVGGVALAQNGYLAPVDVVPFVVLGLALTAPVTTVSYSAQSLREAMQAGERITALLHEPELRQPEPAAAAVAPSGARVEFRGVGFRYAEDTELVLTGVDLTLEPGTVTALVGPSGSGKSTLAKLLPRFADPAVGAITLGGVDLREMSSAALYEQVSFVFQDVSLLRTSIRDNIRLAHPDADDHAVRAAADAAQIAERIEALPRGYDSIVGEDALLSGGEQQRVSVARALLANTPILVLDEATAAADPESEAQVQQALSTLVAGRTLLVIAHRLSTIAGADQIVVLDRGRIVERGTHADLFAQDGQYARMWAADQRSHPDIAPVPSSTQDAETRS